jgi:hypothetical protein
MKYSIMVLLVKHEGTNNPVDLMNEVSKYHLEKETTLNRDTLDMTDKPRVEVVKEFVNGIEDWLKQEDKKLYYFGISGEELKRILDSSPKQNDNGEGLLSTELPMREIMDGGHK